MKTKRKLKYNTGVQQVYADSPDYSKVLNRRAKTAANDQVANSVVDSTGEALSAINPASGAIIKGASAIGNAGESIIGKNSDGTSKVGGRAFNYGAKGAGVGAGIATSMGPMGMIVAPYAAAGGAVVGATYGALTGKSAQRKERALIKEAKTKAYLDNANKKFQEGASTDAQSFLAKKGKYKVKSRMIETEGREPIFSPKKADGSRDLLYFNPNDPTHEEGGVKAMVMPKNKYNSGTSNLMPKRSKVSLLGSGIMAKGVQKTKLVAPQQKMSHTDSVSHQADKILKYEQLRGGPGGAPLPSYSDPKYKQMLMDKIYPEINKIMPNASAMEKGEAMDFVFNAGWDDTSSKITKDPRAFALQEYYRKNDPSKLDAEGKWAGRKGAAYSFDKEYVNTIGKLSENERRIMMNKGRDWYYKNINNPAPGVPNSNYKDTWYGRIHNTNDFSPFNPNNPAFIPKKAVGAKQLKVNTLKQKGVNKLEGDLISKVVMNRNKNKDFVKRTQATNMFKTWEDFDTKATHKMAYGEDDKGQSHMFPTILNDNNESIKVPNQYADYISDKGYKKATGMKYKCGTSKMKYKSGVKSISGNSDKVKAFQKMLNEKGFKGKDGKALAEDGAWGNNTINAYREYSKSISSMEHRVPDIKTSELNTGKVAAVRNNYTSEVTPLVGKTSQMRGPKITQGVPKATSNLIGPMNESQDPRLADNINTLTTRDTDVPITSLRKGTPSKVKFKKVANYTPKEYLPTKPKTEIKKPIEKSKDLSKDPEVLKRFSFLKNQEELSRKADSTHYANNIYRVMGENMGKNTQTFVTEKRSNKPMFGKKSGDNTCLTAACNVSKLTGGKFDFNSALAQSSTGGDNPEYTRYIPSFIKNHEKLGFKQIKGGPKQAGDISFVVDNGVPHHTNTFFEKDRFGMNTYGTDSGNQDDNEGYHLGRDPRINENSPTYRYHGIPSKRASMEEAKKYVETKRISKEKNYAKQVGKVKFNPNDFTTLNNEEMTLKKGIKALKYKKGTKALVIPEGSSIVTAEGGMNKAALAAYSKGDFKTLDKIINSMPEDKSGKAVKGKKKIKYKPTTLTGKYTKTTGNETYTEQSVLGGKGYGKEMSQAEAEKLYALSDADFEKQYTNKKSDTYKIEKGRREALKAGNNTYNVAGKLNKDGTLMSYSAGRKATTPDSAPMTFAGGGGNGSSTGGTGNTGMGGSTSKVPDSGTSGNGGGFDVSSIPSIAEIAAKASILSQGVEPVQENYLKLGRYKYASQLPKNLQENMMATNSAKKDVRNASAGNVGGYLSNVGALTTARLKANNDAVIQDTLGRQDILNKNVDLGNVEQETNRGLKDQYFQQKAANRGAYNNLLISTGQSIDSTLDASKVMVGQKFADKQRMEMLKSMAASGSYDVVTKPDGTVSYTAKAKGAKNLKTNKYKRK
jgi:hypothetical protein